jgi:hypothetical protein
MTTAKYNERFQTIDAANVFLEGVCILETCSAHFIGKNKERFAESSRRSQIPSERTG